MTLSKGERVEIEGGAAIHPVPHRFSGIVFGQIRAGGNHVAELYTHKGNDFKQPPDFRNLLAAWR